MYVIYSSDVRNIWLHMQTRAYRNGITFPIECCWAIVDFVSDDIDPAMPSDYRQHSGSKLDVGPQVEVCAIVTEIFNISLGAQKVLAICMSKVGESSKLL